MAEAANIVDLRYAPNAPARFRDVQELRRELAGMRDALEQAQQEIKDLRALVNGPAPEEEPSERPVTLAQALSAVSQAFGISEHEMRSVRRADPVVTARHAYFALARETTMYSQRDIAKVINRDSTTAWHGINRFDQHMTDPDFAARYERARKLIGDTKRAGASGDAPGPSCDD